MEKHNFDVDIIIPSSKQHVKINASQVEVGQTHIACAEVKALRYGVSLVGTAKNPIRKIYSIELQSNAGKTASIRFESQKATTILEEDHTYAYLMSGLWQYVKKPLVNRIIEALNAQEPVQLGEVKINAQGVEMTYKTWFWGKTKTIITPWSQLDHKLDKGIFELQDQHNRGRKVKLSLHHDWNAVVLQTLVHYLWQANRRQKLEKGENIMLAYDLPKPVESLAG